MTAIVASEPSPAMTALKRARKGVLANDLIPASGTDFPTAERSLFAAGGEGSEGVNTPSREFHSPAPYGK